MNRKFHVVDTQLLFHSIALRKGGVLTVDTPGQFPHCQTQFTQPWFVYLV